MQYVGCSDALFASEQELLSGEKNKQVVSRKDLFGSEHVILYPQVTKLKGDKEGTVEMRWYDGAALNKTFWLKPGGDFLQDHVPESVLCKLQWIRKPSVFTKLSLTKEHRRDLIWLMKERCGENYLEDAKASLLGGGGGDGGGDGDGGDSEEAEDSDDVPLSRQARR